MSSIRFEIITGCTQRHCHELLPKILSIRGENCCLTVGRITRPAPILLAKGLSSAILLLKSTAKGDSSEHEITSTRRSDKHSMACRQCRCELATVKLSKTTLTTRSTRTYKAWRPSTAEHGVSNQATCIVRQTITARMRTQSAKLNCHVDSEKKSCRPLFVNLSPLSIDGDTARNISSLSGIDSAYSEDALVRTD